MAEHPAVTYLNGLREAATEGPWAWEPTGDKDGSWGLGYVVDETTGEPLRGQIEQAQGVIIGPVCESIDGNGSDAALIVAAVNLTPYTVALIEAAAEMLPFALAYHPGDHAVCGDCRRVDALRAALSDLAAAVPSEVTE